MLDLLAVEQAHEVLEDLRLEDAVVFGQDTLERLKVDVIEAGFAIASPGDFAAVKAIADSIKDSTVCSLSRALDADIDRAAEALKGANSGRIHTFIATSPIHMQYKLRMQPDQVVEQAVHAIKRARNLCSDVE